MKQYTNNWKKLTNADFRCGVSGTHINTNKVGNSSEPPYTYDYYFNSGLSYNASTGILTFNGFSSCLPNPYVAGAKAEVVSNTLFCVYLGTVAGK